MSDAIAAYGTLLKLGSTNTTAASFATIAEVGDIAGPNDSVSTIDVTNHSSPSARMEFIASLIDSGEIAFSINFLPKNATHDATTGIQKAKNDRAMRLYQMVFPDGSQVQFSALVTKFGIKAPVAGKLGADITLKISGAPVWS
jgi:predicted secreted protein